MLSIHSLLLYTLYSLQGHPPLSPPVRYHPSIGYSTLEGRVYGYSRYRYLGKSSYSPVLSPIPIPILPPLPGNSPIPGKVSYRGLVGYR